MKRILKTIIAATSIAMVTPFVSSCSKIKTINVDNVKFTQEYAYIANGNTRDFSKLVEIEPENASDKSLKWEIVEESQKGKIATVDQNTGVVTAGSEVGWATLKCESVDNPEKSSIETIVIGQYVHLDDFSCAENIDLTYQKPSEDLTQYMTFEPSNASTAKYKNVSITIDKPEIAEFDETNFKIIPKKVGSTKITVTPYDYDADAKEFKPIAILAKTCDLTVNYAPVDYVDINDVLDHSITLLPTKDYHLTHQVWPLNANQEVVWSCYDPDKTNVSVDATGWVTAGSSTGIAYILCRSAVDTSKLDYCVVNVVEEQKPITKLEITNPPETLTIGTPWTPTIEKTPEDATETYHLVSSHKDVATCDLKDGVWTVTPLKEGSVTITAESSSQTVSSGPVKLEVKKPFIHVTNITINPSEIALHLSDERTKTKTLTVAITPKEATTQTVTWSSSDSSAVSVDQDGKITALKTTGETPVTITATSTENPSVSGTCKVTVDEEQFIPIESITLDCEKKQLDVGNQFQITATVAPDNFNEPLIWYSTNTNVVDIVDYGEAPFKSPTIKAISCGTAKLHACSQSKKCDVCCEIKVIFPKITRFLIDNPKTDPYEMYVGHTEQFTKIVEPNNACQDVEWTSSNPSVLTIDKNTGLAKALSSGFATITCTAKGTDASGQTLKRTCDVYTFDKYVPVNKITLDKTEIVLDNIDRDFAYIKVTVSPSNATNKGFVATTSIKNIVSVTIKSNDGGVLLTPLSPGTTELTVTSSDNPEISAKCKITVNVFHVTHVQINTKPSEIKTGLDPIKMDVTILPEKAEDKSVTWTSSNPEAAYVDKGYLIAKNACDEPVTITCTSNDKPTKSDSFDVMVKVGYIQFKDDSWENVCKYANEGLESLHKHYYLDCERNNDFPGTLIGLERTITLNGQKHIVKVIDEEHDQVFDSKSKAALTFELFNLISDKDGKSIPSIWGHHDNNNYTNSILRKNLTGNGNPTKKDQWEKNALQMLQEENAELYINLKTVQKHIAKGESFDVVEYHDKLFPLTCTEMVLQKDGFAKAEGQPYKYWIWNEDRPEAEQKTRNRRKTSTGGIQQSNFEKYWLASPNISSSREAWLIDNIGNEQKHITITNSEGASFAFCI